MTQEAYEKIREGLKEAVELLALVPDRVTDNQMDLLRAMEAYGPHESMYLIAHDRRVAGPLRTRGLVESLWVDKQKHYRITEAGRLYLKKVDLLR